MRAFPEYRLPFRSPSGVLVAHLRLTPENDAVSLASAPLVQMDEADSREHGETAVQLREAERYEYEVDSANGADLRLRCKLSTRRRSLRPGTSDAGRIETGSWCGTLLLELVEGEVDHAKPAVATALIDVRSLKLDYRTEYRGMLRRVADELAGLVVDARSSAKVEFRSSFSERRDEGWLQIQLELLREALEGADFSAALQRILSFPHERLSSVYDFVLSERPIRWTPSAVRQLVTRSPRAEIPAGHPLQTNPGINTFAERVLVPRKSRDLDTLENRFVKFALHEFRIFLTHAQAVFESSPGWGASAALARRLASSVEDWLGRGLFRDVGEMRFAPLGSPVLQRKAGYREVLRWWLRFRTAAELSWGGGEDLFRVGQRDLATLYEYWLFFVLLEWFCRKCRGGNRPAVEELIEGLESSSPNLRLRKMSKLAPFPGAFGGLSRRLNAHFSYNRRFEVTLERHKGGSWTRPMHPDYTLSFWPEGLTDTEAEERELLVHVHFDAKYRVEGIEGLFGVHGADDADEEVEENYKRQDLLKMHAYRDAVKRSQGAYVLYPGRDSAAEQFRGFFHEIFPGLGAFGIAPDENGAALGFKPLEDFLGEVLEHLSNRTTAQERVSYHMAEAYRLREEPVRYSGLNLPETDLYAEEYRALPPAEHMVLVAWYRNEAQKQLAETDNGFTYVRLGPQSGAHVHPNLARVRNVVLRSEGGALGSGLLLLREPGFRVYTRLQLRAKLEQHAELRGVAAWEASAGADQEEYIYALFRTRRDPGYGAQEWDGDKLMSLIEEFEKDKRNAPYTDLERTSPYPRILSLRDLLNARPPGG
jgi:predicted component of viral defense system (DUF524 family)